MILRTAPLLLAGLLAGGTAIAQNANPDTTPPVDSASFEIPEDALAEQGYVTAALVANMRVCGAGEQPLTVFYNHEKRQALSDAGGQAGAGQRFDQGFVLGSQHMQVVRDQQQLKPDQATCQGLAQRLRQAL